ncbi:MAG: hypothetical protein HWN65_14930 [Candidatus Helarchaeota archaeon]|nr:hypothetical protein [Candidatus Helarchaeota archaeon]
MKTKRTLLFLMVGLTMLSLAIPVQAATKPSWALNESDVDGWWIIAESDESWTYSAYSFGVWYQIWVNNATWTDATAAMCIMVMEFPINLDIIWEPFLDIINDLGLPTNEQNIPGLDGAVTWNESNLWIGLGYSDDLLLMVIGYNSTDAPMNPFFMAKTPTDETTAKESDIIKLMTAQGAMFGAIPGFEISLVFITIVIITGVIFLLRKDQLSLLKLN